jgi:hypothetical protein
MSADRCVLIPSADQLHGPFLMFPSSMDDVHRAVFKEHQGWYNPRTGRVRFGKLIYPSIEVAIKYLNKK